MITVTATTTITATTPPTMAAVLSDCGAMVVVLSDVMGIVTEEGLAVVLSNVVTNIVTEGFAVVLSDVVTDIVTEEGLVALHCGSRNELMTTGQLLSTSRCKACTAMVESAWETKISKYANSCELVTWAVPCSLALNVTCCSEH